MWWEPTKKKTFLLRKPIWIDTPQKMCSNTMTSECLWNTFLFLLQFILIVWVYKLSMWTQFVFLPFLLSSNIFTLCVFLLLCILEYNVYDIPTIRKYYMCIRISYICISQKRLYFMRFFKLMIGSNAGTLLQSKIAFQRGQKSNKKEDDLNGYMYSVYGDFCIFTPTAYAPNSRQ